MADGQVVAHMMPDLPNVGLERDINGFVVRRLCCALAPDLLGRLVSVIIFRCSSSLSSHFSNCISFIRQEFFENPAFRADGLKIYPTLVIRGTGMYHT